MKLSPLLGLVALIVLTTCAHASSTDPDLAAADLAYQGGHYDDAARIYQHLIDSRGYSSSLLFDKGNADLKAGHLGMALLDYERARYLAPADAGIDHNLQFARHQAGLDPDPYRWWQVVIKSINWMVWLTVILSCLSLVFLGIVGHALVKIGAARNGIAMPGWLKFFKTLLFVFIPLGLFFGFVELSAVGLGDRVEAVIIAKQATLRISPFESAERTGWAPEGELVTVEKRHDDFLWIDDRSRESGWVNEKELAPIVPGSLDQGK